MFEFLFHYSPAVYARGRLVLLASWPGWWLGALIALFALGLGLLLRRHWSRRTAAVWGLQAVVVALILFLLWQPALSLSELRPRQNIIAVLVDDSRSMAQADTGAGTREQAARAVLRGGLLQRLGRRYQVRVYAMDSGVRRVRDLNTLRPTAAATRIGASLDQLLDRTSDLPLGGVVVLSDGGDNSGGIDRATIAALRSREVPVQTVGFGSAAAPRDVEMESVQLAPRAMARSRIVATVNFEQHGFQGQRAQLTVRDGSQVLASQPVVYGRGGDLQSVETMFNSGPAGAKALTFTLSPLAGESNDGNNALTRALEVTDDTHRVLYIEGEPRWEYKFLREAEAGDPEVHLVSMLRATQNKIYRQGISSPAELADGFPTRASELFRYQALIIGSVQAAYFSPVQQDLIRAFASRRGGGILFMAGEYALGDGGWGESSMAPLLPVVLPNHAGTFVRANLDPNNHAHATAELAPAGAASVITRLVDDPGANQRKWATLPWLMDYQDAGTPKPGAAVLANVRSPEGRVTPLLVTQAYGRGRTAVLASSGTWRWRMRLPITDPSYDRFWQQLIRWLVAGTPGPVSASVAQTMLLDHGQQTLTATVRDPEYNPAAGAQVTARVLGPDGLTTTIALRAAAGVPGQYRAVFRAARAGMYVAQVSAPGFGQEAVAFDRINGAAENFHLQQNRALLERLAAETGGQYWRPSQALGMAAAIPYANAGATMRVSLPLWNLPIFFLLLLLLPLAEWFLRRRWGVV